MTNEKKIYMFEQMPIKKAIATLAIPSVIGCLVMILYNLADTYFVGQINDPIQNAAVTFIAPVILSFNAVNNLFGVGGSSKMSRALGEKDYDLVKKCSSFSFYGAVIFGLVISLGSLFLQKPLFNILGVTAESMEASKSYLFWTVTIGAVPSILNVVLSNLVRAEGSAASATIGTISGCILNVILDPIFILPQFLGLKASGAGLATCISNTVACLYFFVYLIIKRKNTFVSVSIKNCTINREVSFGIFGVGIPASIQNLLNVTGMTILNHFMSDYGDNPVAAIGIAHKITMIPMYVSMGVAQGVMPLIGFNFASRNKKRVKDTIIYTAWIGLIFMVTATVLYYYNASSIVEFFIKDRDVVGYGAAFTKALCLAQPFLAMDFLAVGIFQACGMGGKSLIFTIFRKIILEIPAILILNHFYPIYGMAYSQLIAEFVLAIAANFFIKDIIKED